MQIIDTDREWHISPPKLNTARLPESIYSKLQAYEAYKGTILLQSAIKRSQCWFSFVLLTLFQEFFICNIDYTVELKPYVPRQGPNQHKYSFKSLT